MRYAILVLLVGLAGCTQSKSGESTAQLVAKDKVCATITTQAACTADTADGCLWLAAPTSAIACAEGEQCPPPVAGGGTCQGSTDGDQCVIADQCARQIDQASCLVNPDCGWVPAECAAQANGPSSPGGSAPPCPAFVCQPINPCDGLDANACTANPDCQLEDTQTCNVPPPCPAYSCPNNEPNCPPPMGYNCPPPTPTMCTSSVTCVHAPVVCGGSGGSGDGSGSPPATSNG
jgi:hypothetical protein